VAALSLLFVDIASGINRVKRLVKHNQALFHMAQKLRSALHH
jgi:hypothetical protein